MSGLDNMTADSPMYLVQIGVIGVAAFLILLLIVLIVRGVVKKKKRKAEEQQESSSSVNLVYETGKIIVVNREENVGPEDDDKLMNTFGSDEETFNPYGGPGDEETFNPYGGGSDEETVNPYGGGDDEETVNPYGGGDGEETIAPNWEPQTVIRFTVNAEDEQFEREISFSDRMEIGRDASCQLCLKPMYVSRHHLELSAMPDGVFIRNLNPEKSQQYTRLNRAEIGDMFMPVNSGDMLEIAYTKITMDIISK